MLSENAFKEMPTLADKSSDFRFSSGIQVYFWTQRIMIKSENQDAEKRDYDADEIAADLPRGVFIKRTLPN